jgi:hypothetical protein
MEKTIGSTDIALRCAICASFSSLRCGKCHVVSYCSRKCQKKDWKDNNHKILCKGSVYIGRSLIPGAGRGVFATRTFEINEKICFYDGEDVPGTVIHEYGMENPNHCKTRIGFQQPIHVDGIGQIINDSSCLDFVMDKLSGFVYTTKELADDYTSKSLFNANVSFHDSVSIFQMVATKTIKAHDELYLVYGMNYWLSMKMREVNQYDTSVFVPIKPYSSITGIILTETRSKIYIEWYKLTQAVGKTLIICDFGGIFDDMFFLPTVKDVKGVFYRVPVILAKIVNNLRCSYQYAVNIHEKKNSDFFPIVLKFGKKEFQAFDELSIEKLELLNGYC